MTLLVISFLAGILTVLAPCILPLLPVVLGSSASGRSRATPYIVVGSLALSIIVFTYLLKASTAFIMVPPEFWTYLAGGIIFFFGLTLLFPDIWSKVPGINRLSIGSNKLLGEGYQKKTFWGDVIIGASLGPIFSTCSPTYFVILASVLPASFLLGSAYLLAYTLGLSLALLLIALLGERFASRLAVITDPKSKLRRFIGVIFIALGILIALGYEKKLEVAILDSGFFDVTKIENRLLERLDREEERLEVETSSSEEVLEKSDTAEEKSAVAPAPKPKGVPFKEIARPAGFVNTDNLPIKISDYVGEKVILLDIMTYSCINCQRTFPYLVSWYERYKDDGFIIIGIHTPEFAFERDKSNVEKAMAEFGITYPVVLDNDYGTWNAYGNRYWPRKYLIDIYGNVVYDHIGEGAYEETEKRIKILLEERAKVLGERAAFDMGGTLVAESIPKQVTTARSPETYFGFFRNEFLGNGTSGRSGEQKFTLPITPFPNILYLGGTWNIGPESAQTLGEAKILYRYHAKEVYIVANATAPIEVEVWQDGKLVTTEAGADVKNGIVTIKESRLYKLIKNNNSSEHSLELRIRGSGASFFAFTFG